MAQFPAFEGGLGRERALRAELMRWKKDGAAEKGAVRWEGSEFDYRLRVRRHRFGYRVDKGGSKIFVDDAWFK
jgi:hypothetical protein